MPTFLDELASHVHANADRMRQLLVRGRVSPLDDRFIAHLRRHWVPLERPVLPQRPVIAVDGSRAIRPYASGATLYIVRAAALCGQARYRRLEADAFLAVAKPADVNAYVSAKMEAIEFEAGRAAVEEGNYERPIVLLDGSLHGRLLHPFRDAPAEGDRGFLLNYFRAYRRFLQTCRDRHALVLGLSKDSQARFLRDYLLNLMFDEWLKESKLPSGLQQEVTDIFRLSFRDPLGAFQRVRGLQRSAPTVAEALDEMIQEARAARPDHQLIGNFAETPGYSTPLELGITLGSLDRFHAMIRQPARYVENNFRRALAETNKPDQFVEEAIDVLKLLPQFPAIISFHALLDSRDTPIRVDTPSWTFHRNTTLGQLEGAKMVLAPGARELVQFIQAGYAGLRDYNIWLKQVDQEVRLPRRVVDHIYESVINRMLGITLVHARGYRRVRYP